MQETARGLRAEVVHAAAHVNLHVARVLFLHGHEHRALRAARFELLQFGFQLLHVLGVAGFVLLARVGGGGGGGGGDLGQLLHRDKLHGVCGHDSLGAIGADEDEARAVLLEAELSERYEAALDGRGHRLVHAHGGLAVRIENGHRRVLGPPGAGAVGKADFVFAGAQ